MCVWIIMSCLDLWVEKSTFLCHFFKHKKAPRGQTPTRPVHCVKMHISAVISPHLKPRV